MIIIVLDGRGDLCLAGLRRAAGRGAMDRVSAKFADTPPILALAPGVLKFSSHP